MSSAISNGYTLQWSVDGVTSPGPATAIFGQLGVNVLDGYQAAASFTSCPLMVKSADAFSLQLDGYGFGTFAVQVSNDKPNLHADGMTPDAGLANWTTLYFWSQASQAWVTSVTASGSFSFLIEEDRCTYRWIRLVYTRTSGTLTITARAQLKGGS